MSQQSVSVGNAGLGGVLTRPAAATALVIFSLPNVEGHDTAWPNTVARRLNASGFATLLVDLLTERERHDRTKAFDVALGARRLVEIIDWAGRCADTARLPIGLIGEGAGSATAIDAAVARPDDVAAIVSLGGRVDLHRAPFHELAAPVLLIVGNDDPVVLSLDRNAIADMNCPSELKVIPEASHPFSGPSALDDVADAAQAWFEAHIRKREAG